MAPSRTRTAKRSGSGVVVGLSGGVDSSTALWLLRERGHRAVGVTLRMHCPAVPDAPEDPCRGTAAEEAASRLCRLLGVPHRVVDVRRRFAEAVVEPFIDAYRRGLTPNPCIRCNEHIKFPALAREADRLGFALIATGHHARTVRGPRGRVFLARGVDAGKDQSYFLYRVPIALLARSLFPVGGMSKAEVRRIASAAGFMPLDSRESQDICFLSGGSLDSFLERFIERREGDVVDPAGELLGRHGGAWRYTVGQRRGLGIAARAPLYVARIDAAGNRIVLAPESELYERTVHCREVRFRSRSLLPPLDAKIRYRNAPSRVSSLSVGRGGMSVTFREPQRAPTPGQSLVLYRDGVVLGGGVIVGVGGVKER